MAALSVFFPFSSSQHRKTLSVSTISIFISLQLQSLAFPSSPGSSLLALVTWTLTSRRYLRLLLCITFLKYSYVCLKGSSCSSEVLHKKFEEVRVEIIASR